MSINGGASSVQRSLVELHLPATDASSIYSVLLSNTGAVDSGGRLSDAYEWTSWWASSSHKTTWRLAPGTGVRTVYAQWLDIHGHAGPIGTATTVVTGDRPGVLVRILPTEASPAVGGFVGAMATVTAADGLPVRDGVLELSGAPGLSGTRSAGDPVQAWTWSLPAGTYQLTATYRGSAELADASATVRLVVRSEPDGVPPHTGLIAYPSLSERPTSVTFTLASANSEAVSYECRLDGGAWATCADAWAVEVAPGPHVAEARGKDRGGTVDPSPAALAWVAGGTAPGRIEATDLSGFPIQGPTRSPEIGLRLASEVPATHVRISNAPAMSGGLLSASLEVPDPGTAIVPWNVTSAATGGTAADGKKVIWAQWRRPDGSWSPVVETWILLDRAAPSLAITVNSGNAWVDDDEVIVFAKALDVHGDGATVRLAGSAEGVAYPNGQLMEGQPFGSFPLSSAEVGEAGDRWVYAQATDSAGNLSSIVKAKVGLDRVDPIAALTAVAFVTNSRLSTTAVPLRVNAKGSDVGSGIANLRVDAKPVGGSFTLIGSTTAASLSQVVTISPASGRVVQVRATDRVGRRDWFVSPEIRPRIVPDASTSIRYSAGWRSISQTGAVGSVVRRSGIAGATATFTFTGRAVALVAPRGAGRGQAAIYINGLYAGTVDLGRGTANSRLAVFQRAWSTAARRTIQVRVLGTAGRPLVDLDAFAYVP